MWVLPPKKLRGAQNNRNLFLWTTTNRIFCHFGQKIFVHICTSWLLKIFILWDMSGQPAGFQSHSSTCHASQIKTRTNKRRFLLHFIFFTNLDVLDFISRNDMTLSLKAWMVCFLIEPITHIRLEAVLDTMRLLFPIGFYETVDTLYYKLKVEKKFHEIHVLLSFKFTWNSTVLNQHSYIRTMLCTSSICLV